CAPPSSGRCGSAQSSGQGFEWPDRDSARSAPTCPTRRARMSSWPKRSRRRAYAACRSAWHLPVVAAAFFRAASATRLALRSAEISASERTLRVDVERIDRVARRHEQPIAFGPAEADVGATLRQLDVPDRVALRIEDADAIEFGTAHAPAAPQVAVHVDTETVRRFV